MDDSIVLVCNMKWFSQVRKERWQLLGNIKDLMFGVSFMFAR